MHHGAVGKDLDFFVSGFLFMLIRHVTHIVVVAILSGDLPCHLCPLMLKT